MRVFGFLLPRKMFFFPRGMFLLPRKMFFFHGESSKFLSGGLPSTEKTQDLERRHFAKYNIFSYRDLHSVQPLRFLYF
jgi:hypothetical protein